MYSDTTTKKRKPLSGAAKARRRVEQGLPRYTEKELAGRRKLDRGRSRNIYEKRSALVDSIKLAHGCTDCGYNTHPAALDFDHMPGTQKKGTIARMTLAASLVDLMAEIDKCEIVCANCHRIRTHVSRKIL